MSSFRSFSLVASVLLAAAVPASAQDFNATPNYGTINLRTGFTPDPNVVRVQSGGSLDASTIDSVTRRLAESLRTRSASRRWARSPYPAAPARPGSA